MKDCCITSYTRLYNALLPTFPYYAGFVVTPPIVPTEYYDVYSVEQRDKWFACNIKKLIEYCNMLASNLGLADDEIEKLYLEFEKFKESGFEDYYAANVEKWINEHLEFIYLQTIKQIYFALDDTGHLVAFIPESWQDINFWTPLDYSNQATYGHLQILLNDVVSYVEMEG